MNSEPLQALLLSPLTELGLFMQRGGPVLWLLAAVSVLIWSCLAEHRLYLRRTLPALRLRSQSLAQTQAQALAQAQAKALAQAQAITRSRSQTPDPRDDALRSALLSRAARRLQRSLPLVRSLVPLCPLLGLLGTVLGMIEVFETMAVLDSNDPKALSVGIARAVLTTMAGLVVALPAMVAVSRTERRIGHIEHRLYLDSIPGGAAS